MKTSIIKPGYLVSLKTSIQGGISYQRADIESDHIDDAGQRVAAWETRRAISNPEEYENAVIVRGKSRSLIAATCAHSSFGLLCPMNREGELMDAITAAKEAASVHNATATASFVRVYVLVGRIAQDDAEAARAIGAEMLDIMDAIKAGIAAADPEKIREAASKAKAMATMLSPEIGANVAGAIRQAREIARDIVRRVEKCGERAADIVQGINIRKIDEARFSFLDTETTDAQPDIEPEAPAARGLDFDAADDAKPAMYAAPAANLALEF